MAIRTKPKFAPDEIVVCVTSFATETDLAHYGERYRGDHPLVREFPGNFVADGTPRSEWPSLWASLPEPAQDEPLAHVVEQIPDADACVSELAFTVGTRYIPKGARMRRTDPIVVEHPHLFRTVGVLMSEL